jgi:glycerol uptake operon antiterminator
LAIETSYKLSAKVQPDYIEVLPGIAPEYIKKVNQPSGVPVIAGGLIDSEAEVATALNASFSPVSP